MMNRYVDLSEKVTATYYDEQYEEWDHHTVTIEDVLNEVCDDYTVLPSAQPETSRIENALHGKSAEEQYDFIWWLLQSYAMNFTDSRKAAIEWLKGEETV